MFPIQIEQEEDHRDRDLENRVAIFLASRHVHSLRRVQIKARGGIVTLRGRVYTFHERQVAIHSAQRVAGVRHVIDSLEVIAPCRDRRPHFVFAPALAEFFAERRVACPAMMPAILGAIMALAIVGCGKGHEAVHPAEGRVLWYGKPLAGAQVVLYPQGQADAKAIPPRARTDSDGRFHLSTFGTADGAPEGEYAVTVVYYPLQNQGGGWASGPNALPKKYASPKTSNLRAQIAKGANTLALVLQR